MNEPHAFDLFLSYAAADRAWVQGYLIPALGVPRERLITPDDFRLGAARVSEIERAVTTSRYSILILSPAYLADEWSGLSEQLASHLTTAEQAVRLIPLLKSECELPLRIDFRVRLDCTDSANWERETARLRGLLSQPEPSPERIECPYPGMIPFRVEDARWFYGRTKEIDELVRRVRVQNFLFVIGPSGSGKSSLVFAGLVAELNKRQPDAWLVKTSRPGSDPITALESILQPPNHPTTKLLLIIDQFEELFTQSDKPMQAAFIARLKSLRAENHCIIIITMRADFYPDLMNSDLWPLDPSERVEIAPLRGTALAEAIAKPAEHAEPAGVYLEAGLVERLLADAADEPGVLPLVQETMVLLWDKRERRLLPLRAYEELGQGNLSGLAVAIATRADAVFVQLSESARKIARRIFLRLVQFGEGRADTRRQQRVSALRASRDEPNEFDRTLKHLTDNRLLTLTGEEKDADRQVDIAHEALIAGWQRFRQWVNERREAEQTRRRLEDKTREWERLGRSNAGLLDDVELREAENWLKSADAQDLGYSVALTALVDVSRITIQQAEEEKEQARQRELVQAKALADEQRQRAETERRSRVRQRYFTIGLAVLLLVAIGAAWFAVQQLNESQALQKIAISRELAANAMSQLPIDPELSVFLALQASQVSRTSEAETALRQALLSSHLRFVLYNQGDEIYALAFSHNGRYLVTAGKGKIARIWEVSTGKVVAELQANTEGISSVEYSPNDMFIVAANLDNTVRIWDTTTGKTVVELRGHSDRVNVVLFSPDSKLIVTASSDKTTRVWDIASARSIAEMRGSDEQRSVAFSPEGKLVFTLVDGKTVRVWEALTGKAVVDLLHTATVDNAVFSPDGKRIMTASHDKTVRVWDITGKVLLELEHSGPFTSGRFSPDGKLILTTDWEDGIARVWETNSGKLITEMRGHTQSVGSGEFSADSKWIVTTSYWPNSFGRVWDANTGNVVAELRGQMGLFGLARFSPDGNLVATVHSDGAARVWQISPIKSLIELRGQTGTITGAVFGPDTKQVATVDKNNVIALWDVSTGRKASELRGHSGPVHNVRFSASGKQIVTASWDGTARVWDTGTGEVLTVMPVPDFSLNIALLSPDNRYLITGSVEDVVKIWDLRTKKLVAELRGHTNSIYDMTFSRDGKYIATASADRTARVWELSTGKSVAEMRGHDSFVFNVAFSPNGKWLATGGDEGTVRIWETRTGSPVAQLKGQRENVWSVAFSPDSNFVVTSWGGLQLWEVITGSKIASLGEQSSTIVNSMFSDDGKVVHTISSDGKLVTFSCDVCVSVESLESLARTRVTRGLTCEERQNYLHEKVACPTPTVEIVRTPTPNPTPVPSPIPKPAPRP